MMFYKKRHHKTPHFPIQNTGNFGDLPTSHEDQFAERFSPILSAEINNRDYLGHVIHPRRITIASVVILFVIGVFIADLVHLQIVKGESFFTQAEHNRFRTIIIPSKRGVILDRNGVILAQNDPVFHILAAKDQLPKDESELRNVLERLSNLSGTSVDIMFEKISNAKRDETVILVERLSYEPAIRFYKDNIRYPGMTLEVAPVRRYITDSIPSLSHILGYTGALNSEEYEKVKNDGYRKFDHIGKQGIEAQYESLLRGIFGKELIEVDSAGNRIRIISKSDPIDGETLQLTIDSGLQKAIETSIQTHLSKSSAKNASVVVLDPSSGAVLALVSWPAFDANLFTHGISQEQYNALLNDENKPLFPRAFAGSFPSGSTIKPTFAAAALNEKIITSTTSFLSNGGVRVGLWFFPDWRAGGHGITDVYHSIADSVNTFYYLIGGGNETFQGLGVERLTDYAKRFGFAQKSGIDLPNESAGFLPSKEWKLQTKGEVWYIGDTYNLSIGQGDFLASPLQMARSAAVFANGGLLVTPFLNAEKEPIVQRIMEEPIIATVKEGMRRTVTYGSAKSLSALPITSAGKTGTAQWSSTKGNHAWYIGFAPYEEPEIAVAVLVEEGADDYLAVPIVADIYRYWFK